MKLPIGGLALAACMLLTACGPGSPPIAAKPLPTPGLSPIAALGEGLFKDETLSVSGRLSCQTCHRPEFAHAAPPEDLLSVGGAGQDQPGLRNAPSIRYASFTPPFGFDKEGKASGGLFRDGRMPDLAAQARQPFLDSREMANATIEDAVARLRRSPNAARFRELFGPEVLEDPARAFAGLAAAIAQ